jgi:GNAT superfamily N-acetyltransferase
VASMTLWGTLWRGVTFFRHHGVRATLQRIVDECTAGSADFIITRADLHGPAVAGRIEEVALRRATLADAPRLEEIAHGTRRASVLREHIAGGDWLFIACHGDRIVAARLMTRTVPESDLAAKALTLQPHEVWDDDMFCLSEWRGRGIARHLSLYSDRYMGGLGYSATFARISTSNVASLRMQRHKGSEFVCHVSYRRFLFYGRVRVACESPAGRPGSDVIASMRRRGSLEAA